MNDINKKPGKIVMIEDHDQAYQAWKDSGIKGHTVVHVDAHIDFAWMPEMDLDEIFAVKDTAELNKLLANQPRWNPFRKKKDKLMNIGNYLFPALRDGIVKRIYWVIPTPTWENRGAMDYVKKDISRLLRINHGEKLQVTPDSLHFKVMDKDVFVCCLVGLPEIKEPLLLDIDTDFMLTPDVRKSTEPGRTPWIMPEQLFDTLKAKLPKVDILTIAYSVNGGFTPLKYKHLGDELRIFFENRITGSYNAFSLYNLAMECLEDGNIEDAKKHYHDACQSDNSYRTEYNNDGIIYHDMGRLKEAEREYKKFLRLDEKNTAALNGLGKICLAQKKYREAEDYFEKSRQFKGDSGEVLLGLGIVYFLTNRSGEAQGLFEKAQNFEPDSALIYFYLGRASYKNKKLDAAADYYKQAVMNGIENTDIHLHLLSIYLQKRLFGCVLFELKMVLKCIFRRFRKL